MATLALLFTLLCVVVPLSALTTEVKQPKILFDAVLTLACDDYATLFRSDDGGKTVDVLKTEAEWNEWYETYSYDLIDVTRATIIKVRCRNSGGPGGFLAEMDFQNASYVTTTDMYKSGDWRVYGPSMKLAGVAPKHLSYQKNDGFLGQRALISSNAYWTEIDSHSSLSFYFRFRRFTNKKIRPFPLEDKEEDEEDEQEFVPFDPEKEEAALLAYMGYGHLEEEAIAAVAASPVIKNTRGTLRLTMKAAGALLAALIAVVVMYGVWKAKSVSVSKSQQQGLFESLPETRQLLP